MPCRLPAKRALVSSVSGSLRRGPGSGLAPPGHGSCRSHTDEIAIQGLAKDCRWDPGGCVKAVEIAAPMNVDAVMYLPEGMEPDPNPDVAKIHPSAVCENVAPLACALVVAQSCAPDKCAGLDYECIPACDKSCSGCADTCVSSCETCKGACTDEACRLECAKKCGACRQKCLTDLDLCQTGKCNAETKKCLFDRDDRWNKSTCEKVCDKVQTCVDEKCPSDPTDVMFTQYSGKCAEGCFKRLGAGCPKEFFTICTGHPNESAVFRQFHADRLQGIVEK